MNRFFYLLRFIRPGHIIRFNVVVVVGVAFKHVELVMPHWIQYTSIWFTIRMLLIGV